MELYIVRCTKTGLYIPPIRAGKSTTSQDLSDVPRTFTKRSAAESAARWWAEGTHGLQWDDDFTETSCYPVKGRDLKFLRVYKFVLVLGFGRKIRKIGETE